MNFGNTAALIGSRNAPQEVLETLAMIGNRLSNHGIHGVSGGAPGSDYWFMKDYSKDLSCVIIPYNGFNGHYKDTHIHVFEEMTKEIQFKSERIIKQFYKDYDKRSKIVQQLQCRNAMQILSIDLDCKVDSVIFWAPENRNGKVKGGTRTAVYLARYLGIKTYNLYFPDILEQVKLELGLSTNGNLDLFLN